MGGFIGSAAGLWHSIVKVGPVSEQAPASAGADCRTRYMRWARQNPAEIAAGETAV
jgi:hypothetical protein